MGAATEAEIHAYELGMRAMAGQLLNSGLAHPSEWLVQALGGGSSTSGVVVNERTALTYSYVFSAVNQISSAVASLPLNVLEVEDDGDEIVRPGHPAQWLLNHQPNGICTANVLREVMMGHVLLTGNAYAAIERNMLGVPQRLVLLDPHDVEPVAEGNRLVYVVKMQGADDEVLRSEDVLHIKGLGRDCLKGYSVVTLARNSFGLGMAEEQHGASHFKHGARPSIILKSPRPLDKQKADELEANFKKKHGIGGDAQGGVAVMHGLEIETLPINNEDSQWLESRAFQKDEVATWFSMPALFLNSATNIGYKNIEALMRLFLRMTLAPWLSRWDNECSAKLIVDRFRRNGSRIIKHDTEPLLASDRETLSKTVIEERAAKIRTGNEARRALGLPRVDGMDEFENPNTSSGASPEEPDDTQTAALAAHRRLIVDCVARMTEVEGRYVARQAAKTSEGFVQWVDTFYDETWAAKMEDALKPILYACSEVPGVTLGVTAADVASRWSHQNRAEVLETAGYSLADNLADNVTSTVSEWPARAEITASWILGDQ